MGKLGKARKGDKPDTQREEVAYQNERSSASNAESACSVSDPAEGTRLGTSGMKKSQMGERQAVDQVVGERDGGR